MEARDNMKPQILIFFYVTELNHCFSLRVSRTQHLGAGGEWWGETQNCPACRKLHLVAMVVSQCLLFPWERKENLYYYLYAEVYSFAPSNDLFNHNFKDSVGIQKIFFFQYTTGHTYSGVFTFLRRIRY